MIVDQFMTSTQTEIPSLASLDYRPYINDSGAIDETIQRKIGVYAIFDQGRSLQLVGYSRDVYLSLQQHLVRQPEHCYWFKLQTIERPSRTVLENIRQTWIEENSSLPPGNDQAAAAWNEPIDVKPMMSPEEKEAYAATDELGQGKLLKKIARRVGDERLAQLATRGITMQLRFNPKIKDQGLLDLK